MPSSVPRQVSSPYARRRRARRGALLLSLCAGVALLFALHAYLNSESVTSRLRARLEEELGARGVSSSLTRVEVDWLGRVTLVGFELPGSPSGQPLLRAERVRIRPSYRALVRGRVQAASIRFEDALLLPGPGGEAVKQLIERLKGRRPHLHSPAPAAEEDYPVLKVERARVRVEGGPGGAPPWELGPFDGELAVRRHVGHHEADGAFTVGRRGVVTFQGQWGESEPPLFEAWGAELEAGAIPEPLRARIPARLDKGTLGFRVKGEAAPGLRTGAVSVLVQVQGLVLSEERLATEPVGPWASSFGGTVRWDLGRRKVRLDNGELDVGAHDEVKVGLTGEASYVAPFNFRIDAHVDRLPYQAALDALPPQLAPGPAAPRLDGPFSAQATLQGPFSSKEAWTLSVNLDLSRLKETARGTAFRLKEAFLYQPRDVSGPTHDVWVGEKNPFFVPLSQLPVHVYRAVTTSEDAGFFAHHGFDFQEMKNSFVSVAEDKRFRGGSTISQQLAKNLFLSRERTFARKVQEALVTIALEASLSKQRILEIYLNIIEWGPGVFGIGEAAQHYFGKDARKLSPKEAAFLATIIPNPIRYHVYFARGGLTDTWATRVHELLVKMHDQGVLTDFEYIQALSEPITFRAHEGRSAPPADARRRPYLPWTPLPTPRER